MSIQLSHSSSVLKGEINLTASKSESNRALIIQALCGDNFEIKNLAEAEDTEVLQKLLNIICHSDRSQKIDELDVKIAGTVMRFLTAFLALKKGRWLLTGEERMKERPIKILVETLENLGADISYVENEGYPPLLINGKELNGEFVKMDGSISSQYISALLMIAPQLKNGLQIDFKGEIISKPYIDMTINMMQYFGAEVDWLDNSILVKRGNYYAKDFIVEADWSAASYWYSIVALAKEAELILYGLKKDSLQGDSAVIDIYKNFGVDTEFVDNGVRLTKSSEFRIQNSELKIDFVNCPDIAQTVAVTCAALKVTTRLTGLKTLRIKETDRIAALQNELNELGFNVEVENDDLIIYSTNNVELKNHPIKTYNDHRMAMAFAPLALLNHIAIKTPEVVKKSYPQFWEDLNKVGFIV